MKLDRNIPENKGAGKYALLKLRNCRLSVTAIRRILETNSIGETLDAGDTPDTEFFVIRLKDRFAAPALAAYALAAYEFDEEYGIEVLNLAKKAAEHPNKRRPD